LITVIIMIDDRPDGPRMLDKVRLDQSPDLVQLSMQYSQVLVYGIGALMTHMIMAVIQ